MGMGDGLDRLGETAAYHYIPSAKMASCNTYLQTPVYKWNLKTGERGWEKRQQQLGTIHDHSWFCKDLLPNSVGISPGFFWSDQCCRREEDVLWVIVQKGFCTWWTR